ncbi:hypothetical protein IV203_015152 [Nitzschia inconspicua]|uniref:Uncharacterized protein n=1 Tax=Nitzschia inconspicua TaxID=303405 RepID=A0A9K3LBP3_9STRA|nr:hypothetical protein IV203_015152 [Nitzschia inconspicua]
MKFSLSLFVVVLCNHSQSLHAASDGLLDVEDHRSLYNEKWPPKNIPVRRYHEWAYSGSATSSQYKKGSNRAVGHRPKDDDEYYDGHLDKEDYYYGPTSESHGKRPSEQKFEYYDKIPKHSKKDGYGGKGKVGKSTKRDECLNYHYEYETEIYPADEEDEVDFDHALDHHYGKRTRGGKGKGGKTEKSSKSMKKSKICTDSPIEAPPTVSPSPTSFGEAPSEQAPSATNSPDEPTQFTPSPTSEDSVAVTLPAFALAYDVPNLRQPIREELDALEAVTNLYLETFFFNEFDGNSFTVLDDFITELLEASFTQGLPIEVDYLSTARFNPFSTIMPSAAQLNTALIEAFTGVNILKYEAFLNEELPNGNVFIGSTVIFLQEAGNESPNTTRSGIGITGITAAAVAFTLLAAGFVLYKRRQDAVEPDKLNKADGTIAGETFTGETYDGTASVSAASMDYLRRYNEEDGTLKTVSNLGTIYESDNIDNVSPEHWDSNSQSKGEVDRNGNTVEHTSLNKPSSPFRSGARSGSFDEIALQGPAYGGSISNIMLDTLSSSEEQSLPGIAGEKMATSNSTMKFSSSYDSVDGGSHSTASSLSIRGTSARRPRTVAEIEALLSADLGHGIDDASASTNVFEEEPSERSTNRPRTVEEIESLLHADLEDDSTLELPFSDEDDTIHPEH